ncbi:hypothetical protein N2597_00450 [Rhizobium sophoriradicis]|nr:hypothetical protein N2597_00450 [Rhizobium leguminosarum bv. phaseoli]
MSKNIVTIADVSAWADLSLRRREKRSSSVVSRKGVPAAEVMV